MLQCPSVATEKGCSSLTCLLQRSDLFSRNPLATTLSLNFFSSNLAVFHADMLVARVAEKNNLEFSALASGVGPSAGKCMGKQFLCNS